VSGAISGRRPEVGDGERAAVGFWRSPLGERIREFLGPFFGLVLVLVIFAGMLAVKDIADRRAASAPAAVEGQPPPVPTLSWSEAARSCEFEGLKAFVRVSNFKTVLTQTVIVAIGALGMTIVIVSAGIDLSAGSIVALTSVVGASLLERTQGTGTVVMLTVLTGAVLGAINGSLIAAFRMLPFIVTLGMMGVARGAAKWVGNNQTVSYPPEAPINRLMNLEELDRILPLPSGVWVAVALAVGLSLLLQRTVFGRHIFAIGSNEATARLCGIRVALNKVAIYALAGMFFGCAGLMQMARLGQGDPSGAVGLELDMIAAVVIGGASLSGGTGSVLGTMVGALVIQVLRNGSTLMAWPTFTQEIIIGAVIVLAVGLDQYRQRRAAR
jgi:ribose transport system permease protein